MIWLWVVNGTEQGGGGKGGIALIFLSFFCCYERVLCGFAFLFALHLRLAFFFVSPLRCGFVSALQNMSILESLIFF